MIYVPLILFVLSTSITPGPNNTLILASGVNYGIKRSLPHLLGIATGFPLMVVAVGLGVGGLFQQFPMLQTVLKIVGTLYLLYLAYKVAMAPTKDIEITKAKPFTFLQALLFQWVNPKAWMMAISGVTTFTTIAHYFIDVISVASAFVLFGAPCTALWMVCGASLRNILHNPTYRRVFNISMALLLVASLIPVVVELYQQLGSE
jgi:threonine/homoserine/homoserine lactone efflux protein